TEQRHAPSRLHVRPARRGEAGQDEVQPASLPRTASWPRPEGQEAERVAQRIRRSTGPRHASLPAGPLQSGDPVRRGWKNGGARISAVGGESFRRRGSPRLFLEEIVDGKAISCRAPQRST